MIKNYLIPGKIGRFTPLILAALFAVGFLFAALRTATATEEWTGSVYGAKTIKRYFSINKMVSKWENEGWTGPTDRVDGLKNEDLVQFRIEVTNNGNETVDDVWVRDFLPDELKQYSGDIEWELDDFEADETRVFTFEAKLDVEDEVGSACVINKAVVRYEDKDAASDSAVVCYGEGEVLGAAVEVLPATGIEFGTSLLALSTGLGMLLIGLGVRRMSESK